jgi:hypothetical protein
MNDEHPAAVPIARVFHRRGESADGWYVQLYVRAQLQTIRLEVRNGAEQEDVLTEAAGFVGCVPEQIQVEGPPWPPLQLAM